MDLLQRIWESEALVGLIVTGIGAICAASFAAMTVIARKYLVKQLAPSELATIREIATTAVTSVEQTMKTADNEKKLDEALALASQMLEGYGINVKPAQLRATIESSLRLYKAKLQLPPPPADPPTP